MSTTTRLLLAVSFAWFAAPISAQCPTVWSAAAPQASLSGSATCSTLWDPDGSGPAPQRLVAGGEMLAGGSVTGGQRVMTWDGTQWQSLANGPGTTGRVTALTTWNGQLVAAGDFTGGGTDRVALWNGSAWQPLGSGLPSAAAALAEWNGNLVAAVNLQGARIYVWNGTAWSLLPPIPTLTSVNAIASFQGLLCAGGNSALERWNGTSWLPTIQANAAITCLAVRSFSLISSLYVGGRFTVLGGVGASRIASTSGGATFSWSQVGNGLVQDCLALHVRATSALGTAVVVGLAPGAVMQLSNSTFVGMGNVLASSFSLYGGSYHATNRGHAAVRRFDGSQWTPVLGEGIDGEVRALTLSGADVIVGGTFQSTTSSALDRIARWTGTAFQALGTGMQGGTSVDALLTASNGDIVAGGLFPTAGGIAASNIARWNGSAWAGLGTGLGGQVKALCKLPNGDIVAGGVFLTAGSVPCARVARWNGSTWSPLGSGMNGDVVALAVRSDGMLFAGGSFTVAGGLACANVAQWNGTVWASVGTGINGRVTSLAVRPNDDVVAAVASSNFVGATRHCERWTGSTWAALNPPTQSGFSPGGITPFSVLALPNGDVVAGANFHLTTSLNLAAISRWSGSSWSAMPGSGGIGDIDPIVNAMVQRADGALIVGGTVSASAEQFSPNLARFDSTCMPLAQPYGTGCSAAGPLVLTADALPWLAATFRTTTTGIAPFSLCLAATGFAQVSIPLASILAEGQPGCTLLAAPDILTVLLPDGAGTARTTLALPNNPALLGGVFFQQSLPLEFTGLFALVAVRASNALALTIGTL